MPGRTVAAGIIGGIAAEIGGGKFGNGALTGAYGYLFNDQMHPDCDLRCRVLQDQEVMLRHAAETGGCISGGGIDICVGPGAIEGAGSGLFSRIARFFGFGQEANWTFGAFKSEVTWANQMKTRGWDTRQITEALRQGESFPATNLVNPENSATRYVHPQTGRSVVIDNATREVIHIGGDGFKY